MSSVDPQYYHAVCYGNTPPPFGAEKNLQTLDDCIRKISQLSITQQKLSKIFQITSINPPSAKIHMEFPFEKPISQPNSPRVIRKKPNIVSPRTRYNK